MKNLGLPGKAFEYLWENGTLVPTVKCPHCRKSVSYDLLKQEYGKNETYTNPITLYTYPLKSSDGFAFERIQCVKWRYGELVFLQLDIVEGDNTTVIAWTDEQIENIRKDMKGEDE